MVHSESSSVPHGSNTAISCNDPYFLSTNDNSNARLGTVIFNGNNYVTWSHSVTSALGAKNKLGFVNGTLIRPADDSDDLQKWIRNDYMVTVWLINSIDVSISESFVFTPSARDLWLEIKERYGQSNAPQLYDIHKNLMKIVQNDDSIVEYYNKLKKVWDQLHVLDPSPECTCGIILKCSCGFVKKLKDAAQLKQLIQFIAGLNSSYDQAKINILSMDPLPPVNRVYHMLQQIERQNALASSQTIEMSALLSVKSSNVNSVNSNFSQNQKREVKDVSGKKLKPDRYCEFCKTKGHLKDQCFKLVGYPDWYKGKQSTSTSGNPANRPSNTRFAANVQESPLDYPIQESSFPIEDGNAALFKDFLRFMQMNQSGNANHDLQSVVNFVETFSAFNATSTDQCANKDVWIIDTGASDHMAISLDVFSATKQLQHPFHIALPDGSIKQVNITGTVVLNSNITLTNVFYIPEFRHNLLSVARLLDQHNLIGHFHPSTCVFKDLSSNVIKASGIRHGGLYKLLTADNAITPAASLMEGGSTAIVPSCSLVDHPEISLEIFHARLGHMSLSKFSHLTGYSVSKHGTNFHCEACIMAKHHKLSFSDSMSIAAKNFDLIHIDLWGPYKTPSLSGATYFLTILDDHSRTTWTTLIVSKTQVLQVISAFLAYVTKQFGTSVKSIRSDNGTEIVQHSCTSLFTSLGIVHQKSIPGNPQQNGRVERKHRHLLDTARAIRIHANLPLKFWGDCIMASTFLINLMPSSVLSWRSPYQVLMEADPDYSQLRTIGCLCYAAVKSVDKFAPRALKCILLGYPYGQKGYKLYDLNNHKVVLSRDVVFKEHILPYKQTDLSNQASSSTSAMPVDFSDDFLDEIPTGGPYGAEHHDSIESSGLQDAASIPVRSSPHVDNVDNAETSEASENRDVHMPVRKSSRISVLPKKFDDFVIAPGTKSAHFCQAFNVYAEPDLSTFSSAYLATLDKVLSVHEPTSYYQAKHDPKWVAAMEAELQALEQNDTWDLVVLPPGKTAIGCKWVFKAKFNPDGSLNKCKARLVARGDKQIKGKDYKHTFSPVARFTTVRTLIALAAAKSWPLHQLDINNAFLHGFVEEELYMQPPLGYNVPPGMVCRLKRSIYGLRQAARQWNVELSKHLLNLGFKQSRQDYSLFVKVSGTGDFTAVVAYVDDLLLTGNLLINIQSVKASLHEAFTIKDLGEMAYFLGIEVSRSEAGILLNQRKYILDLLQDCELQSSKTVSTPFPNGLHLSVKDTPLLQDPESYRRIVGNCFI